MSVYHLRLLTIYSFIFFIPFTDNSLREEEKHLSAMLKALIRKISLDVLVYWVYSGGEDSLFRTSNFNIKLQTTKLK